MNPDLSSLQPYPFEKLAKLKQGCVSPPQKSAINLSLGEPQHATPDFIVSALSQALTYGLGKYPLTKGGEALRHSIANWLTQRFNLPVDHLDPNKRQWHP